MFGELQALCGRAGARMILLNGNHDPDTWPHDWMDLADGKLFVTHGHVLLRLVSPWCRDLPACRSELERIHNDYSADQRRKMETRFIIARRCCLAMPPSETRQSGRSLMARAGLLLREIWPPSRPWEVLKAWAQLPSLAAGFLREFRPAARVMLFGHTHRATVWRRGGRLLVNTGGFVTFARPLIAEWSGGRVSIFRVDERNGERRRARCIASESLA
jgi:predicted phosphodiesterase